MMHALFAQVLAQCCCTGSPAPAPAPCPPLPTNSTFVDFEAPHAFVSWSGGTMYDEFTFNPYGNGTYWYGGTFAAPQGWSPFTITINNPASNKFNRFKFIKAGETLMKIYGNQGTVQIARLDLGIGEVDAFSVLDWIVFNTAACGEYITHMTFEMVGSTSFGLFALDDLEFGTVP